MSKDELDKLERIKQINDIDLEALLPGQIYEHYKNGYRYIIVDRCKIQDSNEWIDAIIYKEFIPKQEIDTCKFVRSEKEFREKFKVYEPELSIPQIYEYARSLCPQESIWRSNIRGDNDYFSIEMVYDDCDDQVVRCTTSVGHARYGSWIRFKIDLDEWLTKSQVKDLLKEYIEYYNKCAKVPESYASGLVEHIKATGGHRGNPVWMD